MASRELNDSPKADGRNRIAGKLERTHKKLREAELFLEHLIIENSRTRNRRPEVADFYLSGFFTAARSARFILRIENPDEYEQRLRNWYAALSAEDRDLMDFCSNQRNTVQKEDAVDGTFMTVWLIEFMQDVCRRGRDIFPGDGVVATPPPQPTKSVAKVADRPGASVDAGCRTYLGLLKQLVAEFEPQDSSL